MVLIEHKSLLFLYIGERNIRCETYLLLEVSIGKMVTSGINFRFHPAIVAARTATNPDYRISFHEPDLSDQHQGSELPFMNDHAGSKIFYYKGSVLCSELGA